MKYLLFLLVLFSAHTLPGQSSISPEMKSEIQDLANLVASQLMDCCTSFAAGKNLTATVDYTTDSEGREKTRVSALAQTLTIRMKVSWRGGFSGTLYWINGDLTVDLNSGKRTWRKIGDSGGFSPGCSSGCIN